MFNDGRYRCLVIAAVVACGAVVGADRESIAQRSPREQRDVPTPVAPDAPAAPGAVGSGRSATIHWQGVATGDAIARLRALFDETVFVDRRVDPNLRVSIDLIATSAEQVLTAVGSEHDLAAVRLRTLVYFGPSPVAARLRGLADTKTKEIARLPAAARVALAGRRDFSWPRLSEPRRLVMQVAQRSGWRIANPEQIPHDLWAAGELPDLTAAEQLTLLLIGFDLSFEMKPGERAIEVVSLPKTTLIPTTAKARLPTRNAPKRSAPRPERGTKQVYTLRVQEKPVGAVISELRQRLQWTIEIDEEAIRDAGKSLDQRVTFSVENVDREDLLDALLTPAGLEYQIHGERIRVLPSRY